MKRVILSLVLGILTERIFLDILKEGVDSGGFTVADVGMTAAAIKAIIQDWYLKRWKHMEAGTGVDGYAEFVIDFVLRSICRDRRSGEDE